ncbi:MAG: right-handed parallel beta-helix repeat-containing protein [Chthonomonas sp.]|nr:right-handed parallel beta-helix repeat-containing protein [Chthonomonas sp.]
MKRALACVFILVTGVGFAQAQYGYGPDNPTNPYASNKFARALGQDLVDGVLDQSSNTELSPPGFRKTYYIRGRVKVSATFIEPTADSQYDLNAVPNTTIVPAPGQRARIVHGVGIRSDEGRWHPITDLLLEGASEDPWAFRFINLPEGAMAYYVDLDELDIERIIGGWPQTPGSISDGRIIDTRDGVDGTNPLNPAAFIDAFRADDVREDGLTKPWSCSVDYGVGAQRVYSSPLSLAHDQVPTGDRNFWWARSTGSGGTVTIDGVSHKVLRYTGTRTEFEWESRRHESPPDSTDLRIVCFPQHEYTSVNVGVVKGPGQLVGVKQDFALSGDPFSPTGNIQFFNQNQRFTLMNAPEYVRQPGDMVISYARHRVYFLPYSYDHISPTPDASAQVLNLSLPDISNPAAAPPDRKAYDAPLWFWNCDGVHLQDIDFEACAGAGLILTRVGATIGSATTRGMVVENCRFLNGGLTGLRLERCYQSRTLGCSFDHIQGIAYRSTQKISEEPPSRTYEDFRTLHDQNNWIYGCTFTHIGTMHPSLAAIQMLHRPSHTIITQSVFEDISGPVMVLTGVSTHIHANTFNRCSPDVAESGVIYQGKSLTALGLKVSQNTFTNCAKGAEFGAAADSSFYRHHSCVMLDDGMSGAEIAGNTFGPLVPVGQTFGADPEEYPMQINGGQFNLIDRNEFPNPVPDFIVHGDATVRGFFPGAANSYIESASGGTSTATTNDFIQLLANSFCVPHPESVAYVFHTTPWTTKFGVASGPFSGGSYYGADLQAAGVVSDANGLRALSAFWFDGGDRQSRWFTLLNPANAAAGYKLRMRGNRINGPVNFLSRMHGEAGNADAFEYTYDSVPYLAYQLFYVAPPGYE